MGFLGFFLQEASCSDKCLGSCVPGAEGPVPLLHSGRPHPEHSEALQIPDPCELTVPLGHLIRKDTLWGGRGGWAGCSLSLDNTSRGLGSSLLVLKCSASRQMPGTPLWASPDSLPAMPSVGSALATLCTLCFLFATHVFSGPLLHAQSFLNASL